MSNSIARTLPTNQLRKLEFMLGEFKGIETLYPPEGAALQFEAHITGSWELCERFARFDFFAEIPEYGVETFRALITYSETQRCYRMWAFAASQEDPLYMTGDFNGELLSFVSDPTQMVWGMQRLRFTFRPLVGGGYELLGDRWEPDGYAKHCSVIFRE